MRGAEEKKLGIYWGATGLYFLESTALLPTKMFYVPFPQSSPGGFKPSRILPESLQLITTIQQTFQRNSIVPASVNLSLSANEIIFRTFIIPWMKSTEIKGVVSFEAIKYIPFSLEELYYAYYPMTLTEGNTKRIRVIFVAIKKDVLENYTGFLEQIGLKIDVVEPAPLSLARVMLYKKIITDTEPIALLERGTESGKIVILDHGIPQFVREVQLSAAFMNPKDAKDPQALTARLMNESRISLDYFSRQDSHIRIKQMKFISSVNVADLAKNLEESLSIKVGAIDSQDIVGSNAAGHLEFIHAYGVNLVDEVKTSANFNLSPTESKKQSKFGAVMAPEGVDYKTVGLIGAACAGILAMVFVWSGQLTGGPQQKLDTINAQLGPYKDSSTEKLKQKLEDYKTKFSILKKTRVNSTTTNLLETIPKLLPPGAWINTLELAYVDNTIDFSRDKKNTTDNADQPQVKMVLSISGYVYSENAKEQFGLVNKLVFSLKENELFKKNFDDIELDTIRADRLDEYTVTYFSIRCH